VTKKNLNLTQEANTLLTPNKDPNGLNFVTLDNIYEADKIKIIQKGFQLNQDGKIFFKNYYESTIMKELL
jgi:hypothetical protein